MSDSYLDAICNITIDTGGAQVTREGFGRALILANADWQTALTGLYTSLADMVAAGCNPVLPEYLAAAALFSQNPKPKDVKIGKRTNLPTMSWTLTPLAHNLTKYTVTIDGITASYTSDASATVAEITAGLKTAIDALATAIAAWANTHTYAAGDKCKLGNRVYQCITGGQSAGSGGPTGRTADITDGAAHWKYVGEVLATTDNTTSLGLAVQNAGSWARVQVGTDSTGIHVYDGWRNMLLSQTNVNGGVEVDLAAIQLFDADWYAFTDVFAGAAEIAKRAIWAEAATKLHVFASANGAIPTSATSDVATTMAAFGYAQTAPIFHPDNGCFADCAWLGRCLPFDAGSETWAFKALSGVSVVPLTPAEQGYCDGKVCNTYVLMGGVALTNGGPSLGGRVCANEYIDKVRGIAALKSDMQANCFQRISGGGTGAKLPNNDDGRTIIKGAITRTLDKFGKDGTGFLDSTPAPYVTGPSSADSSDADRLARTWTGIEFGGTIAGAIHALTITGHLAG